MSQVGIIPYIAPYPHDHSSVAQGGAVPIGSITGHNKLIHDALAIALSSLTFSLGCRAWRNGIQAINDTTITKVLFNSEDYDIGGPNFNADGANSNFLTPSNGYYLIYAVAGWASITLGRGVIYIYKNGNPIAEKRATFANILSDDGLIIISLENLAVNDLIDIRVWQSSGGAKNITSGRDKTFVGITKLGV